MEYCETNIEHFKKWSKTIEIVLKSNNQLNFTQSDSVHRPHTHALIISSSGQNINFTQTYTNVGHNFKLISLHLALDNLDFLFWIACITIRFIETRNAQF